MFCCGLLATPVTGSRQFTFGIKNRTKKERERKKEKSILIDFKKREGPGEARADESCLQIKVAQLRPRY